MPTRPRNASPNPAARKGARDEAQRTDGVAPRQCTDVGCCLCFVLFLALTLQGLLGPPDFQKLSRGIDHRGRICGWSPGAEEQSFLYWCVARTDGVTLNLTSAICMNECPQEGTTVLCPGNLDISETEEVRGASILLVRTEKQLLSPQKAAATKTWIDRYCVPTVQIGDALLAGTPLMGKVGSGAVTEGFLSVFDQLSSLAAAPRLLTAAAVCTLVLSLGYLLCLRFFALLFLRLAVLGSVLVCSILCAGLAVAMTSPRWMDGFMPGEGQWAFLVSSGLAGPWVRAIAAAAATAGLLLAGALLAGCLCARRSMDVAADCIRESCAVMLAMPSLVLLPLLDAVCSQLLWLLLLLGLALLLSKAEVQGMALLGVEGVFRRFNLTAVDCLRIVSLAFSCFWIQEVVGAACMFATAHSVAKWYFAPGKRLLQKARHLPLAPALQGLAVAGIWHLGSLARGAFALALLRLVRWALWLMHLALRQDEEKGKQKRRCCCRCFMVFCDAFLATLQALTEFLSSHAYVDIALSSNSYAAAAAKAFNILGSHAGLVSVLSLVACFLRVAGSLLLAAMAGCAACMLTRHPIWLEAGAELTRQLQASGLPFWAQQLTELRAEGQAVSSELLGVATALMMLLASRAMLFTVEGTAFTVLYCLLWDSSDGVLDASHVPESFWQFAREHGIAGRRRPEGMKKLRGP
ncbi:unnamed protein product [Effrenium voratum]|nr:unnamed protein product [Effrenium voratum]